MVKLRTCSLILIMRWHHQGNNHGFPWHRLSQRHQRHPPTAQLQLENQGNQRHLHNHLQSQLGEKLSCSVAR